MADPNLDVLPNYASKEFNIIHEGLRLGYHENDQQVIERLVNAWQANREVRITAWNAQKEAEARAAEEAEQERRLLEEQEERAAREEAEHERRDVEKKKPKMNTFIPGTLVADVLIHPPSQYALQKLSTHDYLELWYFSLEGWMDAAEHANKSQADDTFGLSRVDDHLTVRTIASVRASRNVVPDHELPFSEFLRAKNCFLEMFLETHPVLQLPLGEKIILTYASRVWPDWHCELKAGRGYNISVINQDLMSAITDEVRAHDEERVKTKAKQTPVAEAEGPDSIGPVTSTKAQTQHKPPIYLPRSSEISPPEGPFPRVFPHPASEGLTPLAFTFTRAPSHEAAQRQGQQISLSPMPGVVSTRRAELPKGRTLGWQPHLLPPQL
ncbi:hypothetical protein BU15DRAFT_67224 [Melanogaster broomeanus]|nr:hypothetical protein BU15DRAFT_67224 [Melanogaster broomeanus]